MERQTSLVIRGLDLDTMSIWTSLKKDIQDKLLGFAGEVKEAQWEQGFATLKEASALYEAYKLLNGEGQFREFLDKVYKASWRTGYQRLETYKQARLKLSEEQLQYLIAYGPELMTYRNVPFGEFLNVAKGLPAPKSEKPEDMNPFIEKVDAKYRELKSDRRKTGQRKISTDEAVKMAFNNLLSLLSTAKIKTSQRQLEFLERVAGMVMYDRAIPGQLRAGRIEVPEGFKVKRGRPPKKKPGGHQNAA
jgi:hypothetical protein